MTRSQAYAIIAVWLLAVSSATAEIVRFRMTGTLNVVDGWQVLPTEVQTGAPFVAYVAWDASLPDQEPNPLSGHYVHPPLDPATAPYGMTVQVGQTLFRGDTSNGFVVDVGVGGDTGLPPPLSHGPGSVEAGLPLLKSFEYRFTGYSLSDGIGLTLQDASATALTSDALPTYLDPDKFGANGVIDGHMQAGSFFQIDGIATVQVGDQQRPFYQVYAYIQDISVVPEPAGWLLFGAGALGLLACRRCFRRR